MPAQPSGGAGHFTENETTWNIVATDMTGYADLASLLAAGKTPWPGLDAGMYVHDVIVTCENASGAAGSGLYFAWNKGAAFAALSNDAARDNAAMLIYGGTQFSLAGVTHLSENMIWNVWVRKVVGTDEAIFTAVV